MSIVDEIVSLSQGVSGNTTRDFALIKCYSDAERTEVVKVFGSYVDAKNFLIEQNKFEGKKSTNIGNNIGKASEQGSKYKDFYWTCIDATEYESIEIRKRLKNKEDIEKELLRSNMDNSNMNKEKTKGIYIGKFPSNFEIDQIKEKCYFGGEVGSSWYNNIAPGDYIFPIRDGHISYLWQMTEYGAKLVNGEDWAAALFKEIKEFEKPIAVKDFIRYKYFDLDLTILNKAFKSTKGYGFHRLDYTEPTEDIVNIVFEGNLREFYITCNLEKINLKDRDIVMVIDNAEDMNITDICIYENDDLKSYEPLMSLYNQRNPEKYSLKELQEYASEKNDNARNKARYLTFVINELLDKEFVKEDSPVKLYDNIIVGRRGNGKAKGDEEEDNDPDEVVEIPEDEVVPKYTLTDILGDVFIEKEKIHDILFNLDYKKNIVLQGPPGVGKTFVAKGRGIN